LGVNFGNELKTEWRHDDCTLQKGSKLIELGVNEYIVVFSVSTTLQYNLTSLAATDFLLAKYTEIAAKQVATDFMNGPKNWPCYVPADSNKVVPYESASINSKNFIILTYIPEEAQRLIDDFSAKRVVGIVFMSLSSIWFVLGIGFLLGAFITYQDN